MLESPLEVRLTAEDQSPGHFLLTFNSWQYPVILNAEANNTFSNRVRRLQAVFVGRGDPSEELASLELLRSVGVWLWQALLPECAPAEARHALRTGHTPLLLALPESLGGLPWELLCDPEQPAEQGFLALRRPLMRIVASDGNTAPIAPPLRVLLLISSPPTLGENSRIDVESERAAVEQATRDMREAGLLHLFVEDIVTPQRVQQVLMRFKPHLVHYIGHGGYDEASGGVLLWEDEQGNELPLSGERFAALLRPRNLRAVVLHACRTGRHDARAEVRRVAETLVQEGIPAVLAQQGNFTYESSQRASEVLYQALAAGQGIAEALFEVRQALLLADRPDWGVPILQGSVASLVPLLDSSALPGPPDPQLTIQGAAADLPAPTGVFVGRHRELRELRQMLENAPGTRQVLALITGPGGVGKSTLAAQAVTRYGGKYKAVLTLSCQGYQSVELFLQRMAEFLKRQGAADFLESILPDPKLSTEAKTEAAIAAFNQVGPFLLMVDNLESVQNDDRTLRDQSLLYLLQKLLTNLVRGGRVVITGRYAVKNLLPDEKFEANLLRLNLNDLSPYETMRLLTRHPTLANLGETVRQMLIREFGGLPYVYDLLSSNAASQSLELLIHDMYGRVTEKRKQRSAQEWQAVRRQVVEFAALEETIHRLTPEACVLLGQLSVLQRPFPLDAIEEGLGTTEIVWQPLLDWSLLHYDSQEKNYHLHSSTRRYVESLLEEQARKQAQAQLAAWYVHYAFQDSRDLGDYLEAYRLFRASGDVRQAALLVIHLAEGLIRAGLHPLLRDLCTTTLQDVGESDELLGATALLTLGTIARLEGDYKQAQEYLYQSLEIFERLGEQIGQRSVLGELGIVAQLGGEYQQAQKFLQQSLEVFEQPGEQSEQGSTAVEWSDRFLRGVALQELGNIALLQGEHEQADEFYQKSLAIKEEMENLSGRAYSLHSLGNLAYAQGDQQEAGRLYRQSLEIFERLGDQNGQATLMCSLGNLAQTLGDEQEAQRLYRQSLEIFERLGDQSGRANLLHSWGNLARSQENYEEAQRFYQQSLEIFEQLGNQRQQADLLSLLGNIAILQEDYQEARRLYQRCLESSQETGNLHQRADILYRLAIIARGQGDNQEARAVYQQSQELFEQLGDRSKQATILQELGTIASLQGEYEQGRDLYQQSLAIEEPQGNPRVQAMSLHMLGILARERGEHEQAREFYQQSLIIEEQQENRSEQAISLHELGRIASLQGKYEEACEFYRRSLEIKEQLGDQSGQSMTLNNLGMMAQEHGKYEEARGFYRRSLEIAMRLEDRSVQAMILHDLGSIAQEQEEYEEARRLYQQSLEIKEQLGDQRGQASSFGQLGTIASLQGEYEDAQRFYRQSLELCEQLGEQSMRAATLYHLGMIAQEQEKYEEARRFYEQSLELCEQPDKQPEQAMLLKKLGMIAQEQEKYEEAQRFYEQSLELCEQLGDQSERAKILHMLGIIAQKRGKYEEAQQFYRQCVEIKEGSEHQSGQAGALYSLGMMAQNREEYEEARSLYQQCLGLFERLDDQIGRANTLRQLGIIAEDTGEYEQACSLCQQSLELFEQLGDQSGQSMTLHDLAMIAQLQGEYEEAHRLYQQSLAIREGQGDQSGQAMTLHQLGNLARDQRAYEEAQDFYQRSLEIKKQLGDRSGQARSLGGLGILAYQQGNVEEALMCMIQAYLIFDALQSPERAFTQDMITRIRSGMDEEVFMAQWRALAGNYPLPMYPAEEIQRLLPQVVIDFLRATTWSETKSFLEAHRELLEPEIDALLQDFATQLEQDTIRKIIEVYRLLLVQCREKGIEAAFAEIQEVQGSEAAFTVDQEDTDGDRVITIEELPGVVIFTILQGTTEQRQQLAANLAEVQRQIPPEAAALERFLGCMAAALLGETPEVDVLEPPFTELWQALQNSLSGSI